MLKLKYSLRTQPPNRMQLQIVLDLESTSKIIDQIKIAGPSYDVV